MIPARNLSASTLPARRAFRLVGRILASLIPVAATTVVFSRLLSVNSTTVGFLYLVIVLAIATVAGFVESTIASIAAMLCFNFFFLPPVGTFTIQDPRNWVALFAFLATSLTASQLSARAKRRTNEAVERQYELERLYALSQSLLLTDPARPIASQIAHNIARAFEFPAVALYDRTSNKIYRAADGDISVIEDKLRESAFRSASFLDQSSGFTITPVRLGGQPIGSVAIRAESLSDAALQSLVNLVAIGLERALAQESMNRAEVARRSEELKSTLLDAVAHEFKTPLTSLKAVTTELLSDPAHALAQPQKELVAIADEAADRLWRLVKEAIQLARIEGGEFRLNRGMHLPSALVSVALREMKSFTEERQIDVAVNPDLPPVWVDAELILMVLTHLLDNALKYSPSDTPVLVSAQAGDARVTISVIDRGPGIAEGEQTQIFDKFYRGSVEPHLRGSGMGLSIAREIVRAHGEDISVVSKIGEGAKFCFSMPIAQESAGK